jgi:hypothetical protein
MIQPAALSILSVLCPIDMIVFMLASNGLTHRFHIARSNMSFVIARLTWILSLGSFSLGNSKIPCEQELLCSFYPKPDIGVLHVEWQTFDVVKAPLRLALQCIIGMMVLTAAAVNVPFLLTLS